MASEAVQCWELARSCISGYAPEERLMRNYLSMGAAQYINIMEAFVIICIFFYLTCHLSHAFVINVHSRTFFF